MMAPFLKTLSLLKHSSVELPQSLPQMSQKPIDCGVPGSVDLVLLSLNGCFFKGFPGDFLVSQPNCRPAEANTCFENTPFSCLSSEPILWRRRYTAGAPHTVIHRHS